MSKSKRELTNTLVVDNNHGRVFLVEHDVNCGVDQVVRLRSQEQGVLRVRQPQLTGTATESCKVERK